LQARRALASAFCQLGDVCQRKEEFSKARKYFERACDEWETILAKSEATDARRYLGIYYVELGDLHWRDADLDGANILYEKACQNLAILAGKMRSEEIQKMLDFARKKRLAIQMELGRTARKPKKQSVEASISSEDALFQQVNAEAAARRTIPAAKPQSAANPQPTTTTKTQSAAGSVEDALLQKINAEAAARGTIPAAKPQPTANSESAAGSAEDELLRMINAEAERQGKK